MDIGAVNTTTVKDMAVHGWVTKTGHGTTFEVTNAVMETADNSDYESITFYGYRMAGGKVRAKNATYTVVTAIDFDERIAAEAAVREAR